MSIASLIDWKYQIYHTFIAHQYFCGIKPLFFCITFSPLLVMAPPDLNSLPPSRSLSTSPIQSRSISTAMSPPNRQETPSPRAATVSLAAAASINAADLSRRSSISNRGSPRLGRLPSERRRSLVATNLNLNDPALPSPGELSTGDRRSSMTQSFSSMSPSTIGGRAAIATGDPHHQRQPSLGEIHNELEQEQEAQVNRMLQMIREQQLQLDALHRGQQDSHRSSQPSSATGPPSSAVIDDSTPPSERSTLFTSPHPAILTAPHPTRRTSRGPPSTSRSPTLRPLPPHEASMNSSGDWPPSPLESARRSSIRDETAYYQAETANLTRENQMLRLRIRELEKQVADLNGVPSNGTLTQSNLVSSPPIEAQEQVLTNDTVPASNQPS